MKLNFIPIIPCVGMMSPFSCLHEALSRCEDQNYILRYSNAVQIHLPHPIQVDNHLIRILRRSDDCNTTPIVSISTNARILNEKSGASPR